MGTVTIDETEYNELLSAYGKYHRRLMKSREYSKTWQLRHRKSELERRGQIKAAKAALITKLSTGS